MEGKEPPRDYPRWIEFDGNALVVNNEAEAEDLRSGKASLGQVREYGADRFVVVYPKEG